MLHNLIILLTYWKEKPLSHSQRAGRREEASERHPIPHPSSLISHLTSHCCCSCCCYYYRVKSPSLLLSALPLSLLDRSCCSSPPSPSFYHLPLFRGVLPPSLLPSLLYSKANKRVLQAGESSSHSSLPPALLSSFLFIHHRFLLTSRGPKRRPCSPP